MSDIMTEKAMKAEKAKVKYTENKENEQRRKFIYRIRKGSMPTMTSMKKYGLTLEAINQIRKEAGFESISNDQVKGQLKEKMNLMVQSMDQVVQSVIPNVHVFERKVKEVKEVQRTYIDNEAVITLPVYLECISHKIDVKSVELYERQLKTLLTELGYKKGQSIVPYLKDTSKVEKTIETMLIKKGNKKGQLYGLGSKKVFYQSVSTGLHKNSCPPFEYQMGPEAKDFYNMKTEITNQKDKEIRRDKTQNATYVDWEEMLEVADDYINDEDNSLEKRTMVQVYTQLGGVPRTATFLKLNVVNKESEANDNNKNYYVKDTKTLISNKHKTGINNNKKGEPIVVNLKDYKNIAKNMDELAKTKNVIFNQLQNHVSPFFTEVFGTHNTELRHSQETWVHDQQDDLELIKRASYINAHSIATARDFYTSKKNKLEQKEEVVEEVVVKPKSKPKKAPMQAKVVIKEKPKKEVKPIKKKAPMKVVKVVEKPIEQSKYNTRQRKGHTLILGK